IAAATAITPLRASNSQTKPMRRTFSSRSSLLKPRPFDRCVRTTSPSSTSARAPNWRNFSSSKREIVLLPAPLMPVNHSVKPLCISLISASAAISRHRAIGGEVNSTLLFGVLFPPPAPSALAFAGLHGARTGRATDARVAPRVQRMHRNVVPRDVLLHAPCAPIGQGTDFHPAVGAALYFGNATAGVALIAAQSGGPGLKGCQFALQWAHFARVAAALPRRHAGIEQVRPFDRHQLFHVFAFRKDNLHRRAVALAHRLHHLIGLVGEASRIQREDVNTRGNAPCQIEDRHAFLLEAGGDGE